MILAVRHVLFARPDQLDRRARHLLGDQHGLADVIGAAAPAEAAAQQHLVDVALRDRQAGGFRRHGERRLAVLRAAPHHALVGGDAGRGVHRLHGDMVLVGEAVGRLHLPGRAVDRGPGVADRVADEGLAGVEAFLEHGLDRVGLNVSQLADIPFGRQGGERGPCVPVGVGHDHDGVAVDRQDLLHAGHLRDLGGVEALELAADHGAGPDGRDQHAREGEIDTVDLPAGDLVERVEPLQRLAGDRPVLGILELHRPGRLEPGRRRRDRAVGQRLAGGVRDDAVGRAAFAGRHLPLGRRRRDQHLARHGAALADILMAFADAAAATGREVLPDPVATKVLSRSRIFPGDLVPVATQLLGDELGETGERALPHLGAGDADHHLVVGMDHHPGVDLLDFGGLRRLEGNGKAERETAGHGRTADQEAAAAERGLDRHDASSLRPWPRRGSPRAPAGRCRSGRCWSWPRRCRRRSGWAWRPGAQWPP